MRASIVRRGGGILLAGALLAAATPGCVPYRPPAGWLEAPGAAQSNVYGSWIRLRFDADRPDVDGELLAVEPDSVYVLGMDGIVSAVGLGDVDRADLYAYDPALGGANAWVGLGMLGTLSNGYFSAFTLPLWSLVGGIALGADRRAAAPKVGKPPEWEAVRRYARFPQGLPPGLPRRLPPRSLAKQGG